MSLELEELRKKRLKWVEANRENKFDGGIRRWLTEQYPDNAHFTYELLQNAEDAQATEVRFTLREDSVEFEHNGTLFTLEDVDSITGIGNSTKREEHTQIGKFGVGFKAVFAYTDTPEIVSGEYHFRICDLVVPDTEKLAFDTRSEKRTYFFLPFDNGAKPPERARDEIKKNLQNLDESTLLFLSNIKKIEYRLSDSTEGFIERRETGQENRIEILVQHPGDSEPNSFYFLLFEKKVEVKDEKDELKSCRIAAAFCLENQEQTASKIVPLSGKVSIYFPAAKETSNLRFHLHAPFASTVARDSVRDCPENNELRDHLADLIVESMTSIRDRGLLTVEFLATLPNDQDNLSCFYKPIMNRLVEVFNNEELVLMKQGGHAPAKNVFRGSAKLSNVISDKDLATILGEGHSPPLWIANPRQRNQREDRFLSMLEIKPWRISELEDELSKKPDIWLKKQTDDWHRSFYVFLLDELEQISNVQDLCIIRCSDKKYRRGEDCYFSSDEIEHDEHDQFPCVAEGLYTSGKDKNQQDKVRKFLEGSGVRGVDEEERIKAILRNRYSIKGFEPKIEDIKRFINFLVEYPYQADMFKCYSIFKVKRTDEKWVKPGEVYLDEPFEKTGLSAYYDEQYREVLFVYRDGRVVLDIKANYDDEQRRWALSEDYEKCGIELDKIVEFVKKVGAQTQLCVKKQRDRDRNPAYQNTPSNTRKNHNERSIDYYIPEFDVLLNDSDLRKSLLVWNTMNRLSKEYLKSFYRPNNSYSYEEDCSSLVLKLRGGEWVPQQIENNIKRFVKPSEATAELLPKGFLYEAGAQWLEAVEFGKRRRDREEQRRIETEQATQEYRRKEENAKSIGFDSYGDAEFFAKIYKEDPGIIDKLKEKNKKPTFPEKMSSNPERRKKRFKERHASAPEKEYESRDRKVRISQGDIDPKNDLRNLYTNDSGEMVCQICKEEMPFKKRDGEYYFEAVEVLSKDYFSKEDEAQYIALCPLCAAMYKEFVIRDKDAMEELHSTLKDSDDPEVPLKWGELNKKSIRFVETHRLDVKPILQTQSNGS